MARSKQELERLVRGALGEIKADLIISGGKLINVYSGEILDGTEIAIANGRICYVGPSAKYTRGEVTELLDASGCYIAPGFIDGHTHFGHYARPFENLQSFLPHGTTAVVASSSCACVATRVFRSWAARCCTRKALSAPALADVFCASAC